MPFSCAASSASASWCAIRSANEHGTGLRGSVGAGLVVRRGGSRRDDLRQRPTEHQFHHERLNAGGLLQPIHVGDVRMIERGEQPRLSLKAGAPRWIGHERRGQDLDRDVAAQFGIVSPVDLAHAARPERRQNRVDADLAASQWLMERLCGGSRASDTACHAGVSRNSVASVIMREQGRDLTLQCVIARTRRVEKGRSLVRGASQGARDTAARSSPSAQCSRPTRLPQLSEEPRFREPPVSLDRFR